MQQLKSCLLLAFIPAILLLSACGDAGAVSNSNADTSPVTAAVSPAPVANGDVDQRWRGFFPGAAAVRGHAHLPAGATHQCGLDEIMRQDEAAERLAAREFGQAVIDVHRRLTVGLFGVIRATTGSSVAFG